MVFKRTPGPLHIDTGRGVRKTWRENGGKADFFYVSTESEARDIDALFGSGGTQDVWVKEHGQAGFDASYHPESGRSFFFGALTSRQYVENYERIFGKRQRRRKDGKEMDEEGVCERSRPIQGEG